MSYDVVIAGGGMVGATLAGLLGRAGLRVAVVEPSPAAQEPDVGLYDPRVSALTRSSQRILETLGAWHNPWMRRAQPYHRMLVWDETSSGEVQFDCADIGEPDLGHIVENRVIQLGLEQSLANSPPVEWFREQVVSGLEIEPDRVRVQLRNKVLESRLLVGADGARSRVRSLAGIEVAEHPYDQDAVVALVKCLQGHADTAWQRFLASGPLALLPLPDDHAAIVWSTTPQQAQELVMLPVGEFEAALATALEGRLGGLRCLGERQRFPLVSRQARRYVQPRLALVGDAAHTIHPLAGQGVNLGLLDAASLAEVLTQNVRQARDPGELTVLRRYERWRRGHNQLMDWSMSGFKSLFSAQPRAVRSLRGLGMSLFDRFGPVKHAVIRQAMGLDGDLPDAARGP